MSRNPTVSPQSIVEHATQGVQDTPLVRITVEYAFGSFAGHSITTVHGKQGMMLDDLRRAVLREAGIMFDGLIEHCEQRERDNA